MSFHDRIRERQAAWWREDDRVMSETAEKLSKPNEIFDDLHGFLAWQKWQERGWLKRKRDAILGRKPPPAPPAVGKLRVML